MSQSKTHRESWAIMYAVLAALTLLFLLSFFNRFAGMRSGDGEYTGGMSILAGRLPYRDFFTTGPPLNPLKSALLLKTFGRALIVSRLAGVLERVLIAFALFRWLAQLFRPWHALAASFVTIVVSTGDLTDPIASYNHNAILFAILSGLAASFALNSGSNRRIFALAMASGASAALCLLTKQTIGLGTVAYVCIAAAILIAKLDGPRRALHWLAGFAVGCAIPIAAFALWLWQNHILRACIDMLFVSGPAAKASHASDFLIREALVAIDNPTWLIPALIGLALSWKAIQRGLTSKDRQAATSREQAFWVAAGVLLIAAAKALAYTRLPALRDFSKCAVYFALIALTILLARQLAWLFRSGITRRVAQVILFTALGWSVAVMLSLSWPAFEPMTLPGLGLLLAAALDGVQARFKWFLLLVMAAMVFLQVREKLDVPFSFGHEDEMPVRFANLPSVQPQLRGMRLPAATVAFLDQTAALVASRTQPGDTIFTYPEMGLLYSLTGRRPPTWSGSHNIDVINDAFARQEAERLTQARPAVIVYIRLPESSLREEERMWRHGKPSGQRDIIAAVEKLVSGYRLTATYVLAPGDPPIEVYVRP